MASIKHWDVSTMVSGGLQCIKHIAILGTLAKYQNAHPNSIYTERQTNDKKLHLDRNKMR